MPRMKTRPLWTCPDCERAFANRNQQHSCGWTPIEDHFESVPDTIGRQEHLEER